MDQLSPLSPAPSDSEPSPPPPPLPVLGVTIGKMSSQRQAWVGESVAFKMVMSAGRQTWKDTISDYRTGQITLDPDGCTLTGKAVLPANLRLPILLICILLQGGWLIAYVILEYVIRRDQTDRFSWDDVDTILVQSSKKRVCILYRLPEKPKTRYALGLKLKDGNLENFLFSVRAHIPDKVIEGKIGDPTTLAVWIIIGVAIAVMVGLFVWGAVTA